MHKQTRGIVAALAVLSCLAGGCRYFATPRPPAQGGSALPPEVTTGAVMRAYARYSYYTTERNAELVCEIRLPDEELAASVLIAKDPSGRKLATARDVRSRTLLPIPIARLAPGPLSVTVDWQRRDGVILAQREATILKRPPKPGCEWKIDRADKVILDNGKPFFPFGIMISARCTTNEEAMIKDVADAGFNTVSRFSGTPFAQIGELLDMAKKYNLAVVDFPGMWQFTPSTNDPPPKPDPNLDWRKTVALQFDWQLSRVYVPGMKRLMNHPNLMASYLWDEPQDNRDFAACIQRFYNAYNELDGYHPNQVLYIPPIPEGNEFSSNCDILGIDPYWIPGGGKSATDNPLCVARYTWQARQRADRDLKIAWITPCAEQYSVTRMRLFVESEQRVQTYLSLIQGAKGLLYFVYPFKHQSTYDTFARLGREMKILGPACAAPDVPQTVRYTPVAFEPLKNVFPDVQVSLKKNPAGGYILLVANWKPYPVDVAYKISLLGGSGSVPLLFDKTTSFKVAQHGFADKLAAMDTRAYAILGPPDLKAPVAIEVALTAYPEKTDAFLTAQGLPDSGAPGKKNILRNSGFEACSIPGMPDYYRDMRTPKTSLGYRAGDPRGDCGWSVDTNRPFEGRHSLRLEDTRFSYSFFLFGVSPKLTEPTPFVFSTWARSDRPQGASLIFYGPGVNTKRNALTNEWRRFSQVVTIQPEVPWAGHYFGFYTPGVGSNTVWIDAMQMEKGSAVTDYAP